MPDTKPDSRSAGVPKGATALLLLADGTAIWGRGFGAEGSAVGELVFNTAMTGYQEVMTDPSYAAQIVTFTFPHIGNVGANDDDIEADDAHALGCVVREDVTRPSSFRSNEGFDAWMKARGRIGISGIDTRALTRRIREAGAPNAVIAHNAAGQFDIDALLAKVKAWPGLKGMDLAKSVSGPQKKLWDGGPWRLGFGYAPISPSPYQGRGSETYRGEAEISRSGEGREDTQRQDAQHPLAPSSEEEGEQDRHHVVAIDYGAKRNIFRNLVRAGAKVTVLPATASYADIMAEKPDGVFLSNGPGDPAATGEYAVPVIKKLLDADVPIFGICLGHQLLALAAGARTIKMHQGHRGANHPVQRVGNQPHSGLVEITSMNHGFAVDGDTLPANVVETHRSLFDGSNCGIAFTDKRSFGVQYHPEASPGPQDSFYLFEKFVGGLR